MVFLWVVGSIARSVLAVAGAGFALLEELRGREERVSDPGVLEVVEALADQSHHIHKTIDVRAGKTAQFSEESLAARRDSWAGKYQISVHA